MDSYQIGKALNIIPEIGNLFKGCYFNRNIPFELKYERECFFIVNTIVELGNMGHWILFYVSNQHLYFFDSFGIDPMQYGWDIARFFSSYGGCKTIVFNRPIQSEFSYVCGAYVILF